MANLELFQEVYQETSEKDVEKQLMSSITLPKYKKLKKAKKNVKYKTLKLDTTYDPETLILNSTSKYTTIKITKNLYYSIDKWAYIYLDPKMFIPNTNIIGHYDVYFDLLPERDIKFQGPYCKMNDTHNVRIEFKFNTKLELTSKKQNINEHIRTSLGKEVFKELSESNQHFSKFLNTSVAIPFCIFKYRYYIHYIIDKHKIAIEIYNNNDENVTQMFDKYKFEIRSWVIHTLEKHDKNFYIHRLEHRLKEQNNELAKCKSDLEQYRRKSTENILKNFKNVKK